MNYYVVITQFQQLSFFGPFVLSEPHLFFPSLDYFEANQKQYITAPINALLYVSKQQFIFDNNHKIIIMSFSIFKMNNFLTSSQCSNFPNFLMNVLYSSFLQVRIQIKYSLCIWLKSLKLFSFLALYMLTKLIACPVVSLTFCTLLMLTCFSIPFLLIN